MTSDLSCEREGAAKVGLGEDNMVDGMGMGWENTHTKNRQGGAGQFQVSKVQFQELVGIFRDCSAVFTYTSLELLWLNFWLNFHQEQAGRRASFQVFESTKWAAFPRDWSAAFTYTTSAVCCG